MKLGQFELFPLLDGFFGLDGGAMFGRVPKEIWKKTNPSDRQNRVLLALRCLLIKTGKRNILIDTGIGDKHDLKFSRRYAVNRKINLKSELKKIGLLPEDIDIVINTHLHFDHCGGNTQNENGRIILSFLHADYIIQEGEWKEAISDNILTRASYRHDDFLPLKDYKAAVFIEKESVETEIEKGITLIRTGGHTKYHQIVKIESDEKQAVYLADLVPTASHLNYPFVMAYDLFPLETVKRKIEILEEALKNNAFLLFEHDPKVSVAYAEMKNGKISISNL